MYNIDILQLPKGKTSNEYIREIYNNAKTSMEIEEAKEKIFRLTYRYGLKEIKKYKDLIKDDDAISIMSIAFMKTYNNYDPSIEGSFLGYYSSAIKSAILRDVYGKYANTADDRALVTTFKNNTSSYNNLIEDKEGKYNELIDTFSSDYNLEEDVETREWKDILFDIVDRKIDIPSSRNGKTHADIFKTFIAGKLEDSGITTDDIGKMYGMTGNNVRKLINHKKKIVKECWVKETTI